MAMAEAADALKYDEAQLTYLKQALDVDPKDPDVNRKCGRTLARMGQFDQAIACWHRVEQAKPGDEEAARALADLAIEKTISQGATRGPRTARTSWPIRPRRPTAARSRRSNSRRSTSLKSSSPKSPTTCSLYLELADLHTREERHDKAEEVLNGLWKPRAATSPCASGWKTPATACDAIS